jgi:hypothetical protein
MECLSAGSHNAGYAYLCQVVHALLVLVALQRVELVGVILLDGDWRRVCLLRECDKGPHARPRSACCSVGRGLFQAQREFVPADWAACVAGQLSVPMLCSSAALQERAQVLGVIFELGSTQGVVAPKNKARTSTAKGCLLHGDRHRFMSTHFMSHKDSQLESASKAAVTTCRLQRSQTVWSPSSLPAALWFTHLPHPLPSFLFLCRWCRQQQSG